MISWIKMTSSWYSMPPSADVLPSGHCNIHDTHVKIYINRKLIEERIEMGDFNSIRNDKELFWEAFLLYLSSIPSSNVNIIGNKLYAENYIYNSILETSVQILNNFRDEKSGVSIHDMVWNYGFRYIKGFIEYMDGVCTNNGEGILTIKWNGKYYKIPPLPISHNMNMSKLYRSDLYRDFTLIAGDDRIPIHAIILHTYSNDVMRALMSSNMKETYEKSVDLGYSKEIVLAFVDYLYLGGDAMVYISTLDVEQICELYEFSHQYMIDDLKVCALNLISLNSYTDSYYALAEFNKIYKDNYIERLLNYHLANMVNDTIDWTPD